MQMLIPLRVDPSTTTIETQSTGRKQQPLTPKLLEGTWQELKASLPFQ